MCGDSWNADTARVACRQLGLPSTGRFLLTSGYYCTNALSNPSGVAYNSYYKPLPELGPFYLKTIWCDGTEPRLDTCTIDSGVSYGFWCSWRSGTGVTDYDYYVAALRCLRKKIHSNKNFSIRTLNLKLYLSFNYVPPSFFSCKLSGSCCPCAWSCDCEEQHCYLLMCCWIFISWSSNKDV